MNINGQCDPKQVENPKQFENPKQGTDDPKQGSQQIENPKQGAQQIENAVTRSQTTFYEKV
jgi:hypothetical protein